MKLALILVTCFIQNIDSKRYQLIVDDDLLPYTIDPNVPSFLEYFSREYLIMEQIDDDQVRLGGYGLSIKSMVPYMPLQMAISTQYMENSVWKEGAIRFVVPHICSEFVQPSRIWYNITKLWTYCPPQNGEKWMLENQIISLTIDLPPSFKPGRWRVYFLFTQGVGGLVTKFGAMVECELINRV